MVSTIEIGISSYPILYEVCRLGSVLISLTIYWSSYLNDVHSENTPKMFSEVRPLFRYIWDFNFTHRKKGHVLYKLQINPLVWEEIEVCFPSIWARST